VSRSQIIGQGGLVQTANRVVFALVMLAAAIIGVAPVVAATYVLSPDGLGDYPTIQAAVDAAVDGDVIELTDGTFMGDGNRDIVVPSENITIRSQSGDPTMCGVNCGGAQADEHRGFHFTSTGSGVARLEGVGIIGGFTTTSGAGIWIDGGDAEIVDCMLYACHVGASRSEGGGGIAVTSLADPTLTGCLITGCSGSYGGGMRVFGAGGTYESCTFNDNTASEIGGGVYVSAVGTFTMTSCEITSNTADRAGGVRLSGGTPELVDCVVARNWAAEGHSGGVWLQSGALTNCTIVDNLSTQWGGNITCAAGSGVISHCIVAFADAGDGIYADDPGNAPVMNCCDVYGNVGDDYGGSIDDQTGLNGNISVDPELCGLGIADYRLFDTSPCLPGGNDCMVLLGALGIGCDSPVEPLSWGGIKALYR